jgi:lysozyme
MNMTYSKDGMNLTKDFEQCRLMPYLDGGGVPTDGWGNTHKVVMGVRITQEKADADLLANVQDAVDAVNDHVIVPLTQSQFDALVDFVFNVGTPQFKSSTLLRKLNAGDYQGAHDQFDRWILDNGKFVNGLQRRRDAEQSLWESDSIVSPFAPVETPVIVDTSSVLADKPQGAWVKFFELLFKFFAGLGKKT